MSINILYVVEHSAQYEKENPKYQIISGLIIYFISACRYLVGKPEGKRPLGRPRRRWEDNTKMDLQEVGGSWGIGWSWLRIGTGGWRLWIR
jgi:hypothetical protein